MTVANAGWGLDGKLVEMEIPKKCALPPKKFTNARVSYPRYGTRTRTRIIISKSGEVTPLALFLTMGFPLN